MNEMTVSELEAAVLTQEEVKEIRALLRERGRPNGWVVSMLKKVEELPGVIQDRYPEPRTPDSYYELQKYLNVSRPTETEIYELLRFKEENTIAGQAIRKLASIVRPDFE